MNAPHRPTRFYRIVLTDPPTLWDFMSLQARGRELSRRTPAALDLWDDLSVFESLEQARAQRGRFPHLGSFVAEMEVPPDAGVRCERTTSRDGHWTLWADPDLLLALVTVVTSA